MNNKLRKLLTHYQQERDKLQLLIDSCVEEGEYKLAQRYSKGLVQLNQKLQTLHNLADPLHDEKQRHTAVIARIKAILPAEAGAEHAFDKAFLQEQEGKLAQLQEMPASRMPHSGQSHVQETLNKLFEKRIESFTLLFGAAAGFSCSMKMVRKTVLVTIPDMRRLRNDYLVEKSQVRQLLGLGFRFFDSRDKLVAFLPCFTSEDTAAIKLLLVKICFDVFYFRQFEGQAQIKYVEPRPEA
ncbi:hypothetical protein [Hymenobacter sediminicola]|uniref:Uncharacterized protein n=1 Tax=Hymenobacter sediminicola TaxID=2761579 RepID=A0A7G7WBW3_9BACT|nr:hypothetical protein [Hymenobacter sediminicola]QNH63856.1 hypothetical protein H4317_08700 [Hymenobacter sediminicola]